VWVRGVFGCFEEVWDGTGLSLIFMYYVLYINLKKGLV
jgi:hypothetical protein